MKLWLSKNSEVPMRQQLVTQITLGVASGDLQAGEKLPSRGEIARRFDIHENTVSNAYKELSEKGLIRFKQGSGFFVCETQIENFESEKDINTLAKSFIKEAQQLGCSNDEIKESVKEHLNNYTSNDFLVIETDENLREILISEIFDATNVQTSGTSFENFEQNVENYKSFFVALSDEEEKINKVLPNDKTCIYLNAGSVPNAMQGETRPSEDSLIAVASGWRTFLMMAKTILVAAKVDGESIILRETDDEDWQRGLDNAEMIICDSLTAKKLPSNSKVRPFPLIAEKSIKELCNIFDTIN